jgi:outer membrane murein-binding lipoprotein Lpp
MKMTEIFEQLPLVVTRVRTRILFGAVGSAAILLSGCAEQKKAAAIPWRTAVLVRPNVPQHPPETEDAEGSVPDLRLEIPPPAPLAMRNGPARPRIVAPPTNQNGTAVKPETPQIVPELSTQESAALQRQTEQSMSAAERNLAATNGKSLNAVQSDLASKVRSFVSDAREAGKAGDWARARDLARKAQVLSEELAKNL